MKTRSTLLTVVAALSLTAAPVNAVQIEGNKLVLSPDEMQACAAQGGCYLLTRAQLEGALNKAVEAAKSQCGLRA